MQPRLLFGVLVRPAPIIMAVLATIFGLLLFVSIVGLLMLAWIANFIEAAPLLGALVVGGGMVVLVGSIWLLVTLYRR